MPLADNGGVPKLVLKDSLTYSIGEYSFQKDIPVEVEDSYLYNRLIATEVFEEIPPRNTCFASYTGPFGDYPLTLDGNLVYFAGHNPVRLSRRVASKLSPIGPFSFLPLKAIMDRKAKCGDPFTLLLVRNRGAGDVLITTALARGIREQYPMCQVHFSTAPYHRCLLQENPDISGIHTMGEVDPFDFDLDLNLCERSEQYPRCRFMRRTDIYAWEAGLTVPLPKTCLVLTKEERDEAQALIHSHGGRPRSRTPRIALQPLGSGPHRSLAPDVAEAVIRLLVSQKKEVVLYGQTPDHCPWEGLPVVNLCGKLRDVRQAAAVIAVSDLWLGPDSFGVHAASALDPPVPALSVFTTIDPALRLWHYPSAWAITTEETLSCQPCNDAISCGGRYPCRNLDPERIVETIDRILAGTMPRPIYELPVGIEGTS